MHSTPHLRRGIAALGTLTVFGAVLAVAAISNAPRDGDQANGAQPPANAGRSWPLFGGTVGRNLVNLVEKNIRDDWDVGANPMKNVAWAADLGSKAYGGPVVAGGKIFVGTNNEKPRDAEA